MTTHSLDSGPDSGKAATTPKLDQPRTVPQAPDSPPRPREIGGPKGPEPTRYGDWEVGGHCVDF